VSTTDAELNDISLTAATGDIVVDTISATGAGDVNLQAILAGGSITAANAGNLITGDQVTLAAAGGIGVGGAINTTVGTALNLTTSGVAAAGNITVVDSGALNTSTVTVTTDAGTAQTVDLTAAGWTVDVALGDAADDLNLTASAGAITGGAGTLTANNLTLDAATDIGALGVVNTTVGTSLNLTTTGVAAAGNITLADSGSLNTSAVTVNTAATAQTVDLTAADWTVDANLGEAADDLNLTANTGAITGGAGTLTAAGLTLDAQTGVGATGADNEVNTTADTLTASTAAGDIVVGETDDLDLLGVDALGGNIEIIVGGNLTQTGNISTQGGSISVEGSSITMADGTVTTSCDGGCAQAGDITYMTTGAGDLVVGLLDAGNPNTDPNSTPDGATSGTVTLISINGSILNGNGVRVTNVRGSAAILDAANGSVGTTNSPIRVIVPLTPGTATITVTSALGAIIDNPTFAEVDVKAGNILEPVQIGVNAAVGASVLAALEEIGFVDWAGMDPDVRLVDCLEPCIKLPPDQLEDEGLAGLSEPSQMLVIRTINGIKLIPVFVQPIAQRSQEVGDRNYEPVMN